ncbi:MAG: methylated-DNA--[protein]-cysteine S-methyltransferase [Holosporales bacterium]|jgi:methylated-DNA-[protein]-cysteine S-methyltransferase|nr:methylated-DNA--[protein]-cysteine S-methyltransferase [Holosporales bacterium]
MYTDEIESPIGKLTACAENDALIGLWFVGQKHYPSSVNTWIVSPDYPALKELRRWLNHYFSGDHYAPTLKLNPRGTYFQKQVWKLILEIPIGETTTYGAIAKKLGLNSARAVGVAVAHNPISIIIPCHRVVGADGSLTGYAGGISKKQALLELEKYQIDI